MRKEGAKFYFTGKPCKYGHIAKRTSAGFCTDCERIIVRTDKYRQSAARRQDKYRKSLSEKERDVFKRKTKEYLDRNKDVISIKRRKRYLNRREIELESGRRYKELNKEIVYQKVKEYHKRHPELLAEINANRRAVKLKATPLWLSFSQRKEMVKIYKEAKEKGRDYHVDHIVPLQGKFVSGLHVPWNLQIIPAIENIRKKNHHASS